MTDAALIVNGFEIRELPDGYVDCVAASGTVMGTFDSTDEAIAWAKTDIAPGYEGVCEIEEEAQPVVATSSEVRPAIQMRPGRFGEDQPRVPFFTGSTWRNGDRKVAVRKPFQRNLRGISRWCVNFNGQLFTLVNPETIRGTTVFNISYKV